jgi:hypothetical protein
MMKKQKPPEHAGGKLTKAKTKKKKKKTQTHKSGSALHKFASSVQISWILDNVFILFLLLVFLLLMFLLLVFLLLVFLHMA